MSETQIAPETAPPVNATQPIRMSYKLAKMFMPEIGQKLTYYWERGAYANHPFGTGYTNNREEAHRMQVGTMLTTYASSSETALLELVDQEFARELMARPRKLCNLTDVLPANTIKALELYPSHPTYLAVICSTLGKMPPSGLNFDQLRDWIENNIDADAIPRRSSGEPIHWARPVQRPRNMGHDLQFELLYSDTVVGHCRYEANRNGCAFVGPTERDMRAIIEDAINFNEVLDGVEDYISDHAMDDLPDMEEDADSYSYDRHEQTDSDNTEWSYEMSSDRRRREIRDWIFNHCTEEERHRLGMDD